MTKRNPAAAGTKPAAPAAAPATGHVTEVERLAAEAAETERVAAEQAAAAAAAAAEADRLAAETVEAERIAAEQAAATAAEAERIAAEQAAEAERLAAEVAAQDERVGHSMMIKSVSPKGRRRSGIAFGQEAQRVYLEDLSSDQVEAILNDDQLVVQLDD